MARMDPWTPAHMSLKLCRDISVGRRVPVGWKRSLGRPRTTWTDQLWKKMSKPVSTLWTQCRIASCGQGTRRPSQALWDEEEQTGLPHIGDLVQKRRKAHFGHDVHIGPQARMGSQAAFDINFV